MPASQAERRRFAAALIGAFVACIGPTAAQDQAQPSPLGPPVSLVPQAPTPAPSSAAPTAPGAPSPALLAMPALAPQDPSWSGVLNEEEGGFPQTMWRGTERGFIASALPLMLPTTSPALQELGQRVLLSNAASPAGDDPPQGPSLAAVRLDRLLALGDVTGALAMMDALPPDPTGDGLDRTRVELRFAANDQTNACKLIADRITHYQDPWWQRALIACQALQGDGAAVSLGLSVLADAKTPPDPVFLELVNGLTSKPHKLDKFPDPTPMRLALLAATKEPLPADALAAAGPSALLAYASSSAPPVERRLPAAERAALLGAMSPDGLGAIYRLVQYKPDDQAAALKDGKLPADAAARAVLYDIARSAADSQTRQAAITAYFADAKKHQTFAFAARLLAPAIAELRPADASPDFAADAARALLVAGKGETARPWIAAAGGKALALLARIALPPSGGDNGTDTNLHDAIAEIVTRGGDAPAEADLLVTLAAAFDEPLGTLDWAPLFEPPHQAKLPSAALWLDAGQAIAGKRLGETALTSVLLLQADDRLSLEPILVGRVVAGLRAVGDEEDARAIAIEAALDAGI